MSEELKLSTIEDIRNAPIFGNHYQDHNLWSKLDKILLDKSKPLSLRAACSKKIDDIVGEKYNPELNDADRVAKHIKDMEI